MVFGGLAYNKIAKVQTVTPISVAPAVVFIALGAVVVFITFLACCGALMENQCMLNTVSTIALLPCNDATNDRLSCSVRNDCVYSGRARNDGSCAHVSLHLHSHEGV